MTDHCTGKFIGKKKTVRKRSNQLTPAISPTIEGDLIYDDTNGTMKIKTQQNPAHYSICFSESDFILLSNLLGGRVLQGSKTMF